jgi:hypothetical protein
MKKMILLCSICENGGQNGSEKMVTVVVCEGTGKGLRFDFFIFNLG